MSNAFDRAIAFILREDIEGGLSDHPEDPGGRTNLGITAQTLINAKRDGMQGMPATVDDLTREQAIKIYKFMYWFTTRCDELPEPLAFLTFDAAVQHSPTRAIMFLQYGLGVTVDGNFGPRTLAAAKTTDLEQAMVEMLARRGYFYMRNHNKNLVFGLGWARRLVDVGVQAYKLLEEKPQ